MSERKHINTEDVYLIDRMINFLIGQHNEIIVFCQEECPYFSSCRDFVGACAIQTVMSVTNWSHRILMERKEKIKRMERRRKSTHT